jgi:hypothetical protein
MADNENPLTANDKDTVLGRIKTLKNLLAEMEENDKIPEDDRVRMQANLKEQLDECMRLANAAGHTVRRNADEP